MTKPNKPDPRPMRVVYGAGAVAVASVMAVGLVQPDFTATADQQAASDANAADPNAGADQLNAGTANSNGQARNKKTTTDTTQANVQVKHVVKYIHLKPGQTAPPGATVITPGQPTPRIVVANNPAPAPNKPVARNPNPPAAKPPPAVKNPPAVKPPPPPAPKPTVKTRQSGHP